MKNLTMYCSVLYLLSLTACNKPNGEEISDKIVLKIDNVALTEYEINKNLPSDLAGKPQSKSYKKWMENYISECYFLADAYKKKYDTLSSVSKTLENSAKEMVGRVDGYLWQKQAKPQLEISDKELKEAHAKREWVYYLDYILIPDTLKASKLVKSLAISDPHTKFEALREECSKNNDIIIRSGPYQWPFVEVYPAASKIVAMKEGTLLPPINASNGTVTYLIYLSKKEKVNLVPFEREKEIIYWDLYTVKARKIVAEKQHRIFSQAQVTLNEQLIDGLADAFATIKDSKDSTSLLKLTNDTLMRYIFKEKTTVFTVNNYLDYVKHFPFLQEDYRLKKNISLCLKNIVIKEYTYDEAGKLGILNEKKYLLDRKNFLNNLVLAEYYERELRSRILVNEEKLLNYYELHKAEFLAPELTNANFLLFDNIDAAYRSIPKVEHILKVNDFSSFSDNKMLPDLSKYLPDQEIKFNSSEYSQEFIQAVFNLEEYRVSEPIIHKDQALLFFVTEKKGNRIKSYPEVESQLKYQLEKQELNNLKIERLKQLKSIYNLSINDLETIKL